MAIMSNADLAALELPSDSPAGSHLEEIKNASRRARSLTQQLLAFSRKQVLQTRVLDLNSVVRDTEQILRRLIGETIEMTVTLDPAAGTVSADPGQLSQVLVNLCVNARDAMPEGGALSVETANREVSAADAASNPGLRTGTYVMLQVSDTGHGMDEETRSRIFEPFFTTKPPGQGTGLGLSTAYGIVKQSNGYIQVESAENSGTTFRVFLPRVGGPASRVQPAPPAQAQPQPPAQTAAGRGTVLLVEDEGAVREAAKRMLRKYGYTVHEATNGEQALAVWDSVGDAVDLVLTDVVMPVMGGAELSRRLRQLRPGLRVVFMSGYTQGTLELSSMDERATRFLPKPFTADQLMGALQELLDS
jgi:CheY-like chemotaxis protein